MSKLQLQHSGSLDFRTQGSRVIDSGTMGFRRSVIRNQVPEIQELEIQESEIQEFRNQEPWIQDFRVSGTRASWIQESGVVDQRFRPFDHDHPVLARHTDKMESCVETNGERQHETARIRRRSPILCLLF